MQSIPSLIGGLAGLTLTSVAFGAQVTKQDTASGPLPSNARVIEAAVSAGLEGEIAFDTPGDGALWARGANYKVKFDETGTTFWPRTGPDAPSHPVGFGVDSISVGGQSLWFESGVTPFREGNAAVFERGSVEERYEIRPDGMEQLFVFDEPLPAGDLLVNVSLDTAMARRGEVERFVFEMETGKVSYSKAIALDAAGARLPVETNLNGDRIEIRVPAAFVASATYPLTIDPVVASFDLETNDDLESNPDIAYDSTNNRYLVVFQRDFSATDHDIRAQYVSGSGVASNVFWMDFTTDSWSNPAVANSNAANEFLVVAEVGTDADFRTISGRAVSASGSGTPTDQFQIQGHGFLATDKTNPDVGGNNNLVLGGGSTNYCVVFQEEAFAGDFDIRGRLVSSSDVVGTLLDIEVDDGNYTNPSISKHDGFGGSGRWTVVWERSAGFAFQDIYAAQITSEPFVILVINPFAVSTAFSNDTNPCVSAIMNADTGVRDYYIAFERDTGNGDTDLELRRMNSSTVLTSVNLTSLEAGPDQALSQSDPSMATDGCRVAITYTEGTSLTVNPLMTIIAGEGTSNVSVEENRLDLGSGTSTAVTNGGEATFGATWRFRSLFTSDTSIHGATVEMNVPDNDCCVDAEIISGTGFFPFDSTGASADGNTTGSCTMFNDIWFDWQAPSTGVFSITTCDLVTFDTELAIYGGTSCPTGAAITCNDDVCDTQSQITFAATGNVRYLLRLGGWSTAHEGAGMFQVRQLSDGNGLGDTYCQSAPNSASPSGSTISASNSTSVTANDLILQADGLPVLVPGLFYYGTTSTQQPFGNGFRCVGGQTFRLPLSFSSAAGSAAFTVDNNLAPHGNNLSIGSTWYFQYWHRDQAGGGAGFNLSNGLQLTFTL